MHKYDVISPKVKVTVRSYLKIIRFYFSQLFINRFSRNLAEIMYGESATDSWMTFWVKVTAAGGSRS